MDQKWYLTKNKIQKVKLTLAIKPQVEEVDVKEKLCIFIRVRSRYQLLWKSKNNLIAKYTIVRKDIINIRNNKYFFCYIR